VFVQDVIGRVFVHASQVLGLAFGVTCALVGVVAG
jgi:hypothetical protein